MHMEPLALTFWPQSHKSLHKKSGSVYRRNHGSKLSTMKFFQYIWSRSWMYTSCCIRHMHIADK